MVVSYFGLYEEGDIEHINVPPVPSQRPCLTLVCMGRDPTKLPTHYKKGRSAESGEPIDGTKFPPFSAQEKPAETGKPEAKLAPSTPTNVTARVHDGIPESAKILLPRSCLS